MIKLITSEHWQGIMGKLMNKGMTSDAAYNWMKERFKTDDNQMPDFHTTNIDADKPNEFWKQKR